MSEKSLPLVTCITYTGQLIANLFSYIENAEKKPTAKDESRTQPIIIDEVVERRRP